ncbi:hypothetical protein M3Y98_00399400 [Aphelenchoides besseyi]|nr:hypothetical protein M3Y98_00399400 [Aphelenchoides besseyi]
MSRYNSAAPPSNLTSTDELKRVVLTLWKIDIGDAMVSGQTQKATAMADIGYEVVNFTVKRLKGSISNLPTLLAQRIQKAHLVMNSDTSNKLMDKSSIAIAWRAIIGERVMNNDLRTAQLMSELTNVVVDFTNDVIHNNRNNVVMQVSKCISQMLDSEKDVGRLAPRADDRFAPPLPGPSNKRNDEYDNRAPANDAYDEYVNKPISKAFERKEIAKKEFKRREEPDYFDITHYDKIHIERNAPMPYLVMLCGKWPNIKGQRDLRIFRFFEETPFEIFKAIQDTSLLNSSVHSIILTCNTRWNHTKYILTNLADLRQMIESVHTRCPMVAIKMCGFYSITLPPFAKQFNEKLEILCKALSYVEYVDMDTIALKLPKEIRTNGSAGRGFLESLIQLVINDVKYA